MIESLSESPRTQELAVYAAWLQAQQGLQGPQPGERGTAGPAPIQDKVEFSAAARVQAGEVDKAPPPNPPPGRQSAPAGQANRSATEDRVDLSPEARKQAEEADTSQQSSGEQESKAGLSIAELKRLAAQGDYEAKMLLALYEAAGISVS